MGMRITRPSGCNQKASPWPGSFPQPCRKARNAACQSKKTITHNLRNFVPSNPLPNLTKSGSCHYFAVVTGARAKAALRQPSTFGRQSATLKPQNRAAEVQPSRCLPSLKQTPFAIWRHALANQCGFGYIKKQTFPLMAFWLRMKTVPYPWGYTGPHKSL